MKEKNASLEEKVMQELQWGTALNYIIITLPRHHTFEVCIKLYG